MNLDFTTDNQTQKWRAVNDGVMGGRSSGDAEFRNDLMVFRGDINTDGGGFSSVRMPIEPGLLSDAKGLQLRIKSDGRRYRVTMRTDVSYRGRLISFQGDIPATPVDQWADVRVPFEDLSASLFGRPVQGAKFDHSAVTELGIIIADGKDGSFRLEVASIQGC